MKVNVKNPAQFLLWWFVQFPKIIFRTGLRVIKYLNNSISFTVNIKNMFTPLFGDYTFVGRVVGFFTRIVYSITGLILIIITACVTLIAVPSWIISPLFLYEEGIWLSFLYVLGIYAVWTVTNLKIPNRRVDSKKITGPEDTFRPVTKYYWDLIKTDYTQTLKELFAEKEIQKLLVKAELNKPEFVEKIFQAPRFDVKTIGRDAFNLAASQKSRYVELSHFFVILMSKIPKIELVLSTYLSGMKTLEESCNWIIENQENKAKKFIWQHDFEPKKMGGFGKGQIGRVTPVLDKFSEDLTLQVKKGYMEPIIGRKEEIKKVSETLSGSKNDLLIIGEPGCGKTSIMKGVAFEIMEGTKYKALRNKRLVSLNIGSLIAGSASSGTLAERLTKILDDVEGSGDIILFIDEIHNLVSGTDEKAADTSTIYSILESKLGSERIRLVGATSIPNFRKFIEPNPEFSRMFQTIKIEESSVADTIKILKSVANRFEAKHKVIITFAALQKTVKLSEKLMHERVLPDKAIDVLSRTVTNVASSSKIVSADEIAREISNITEIPLDTVTQDEAKKVLNIEEEMKKMVIGQDHALKNISDSLKRARVGIRDENKPIGSFLFVGTTGVGKTQTAKALAKNYFGDVKNFIRLDMSEYQQLDSLSRLIGSPGGETKGVLTEAIRNKPFTLVLLDEIEKAHPNILLTFLQVLDEGHLTDSSGHKVVFNNTIIIATSNVGTREIQQVFARQGTPKEMETEALKKVREHFAPEFLNRFSGIIVFNPLDKQNVRDITKLKLENVKELARSKGIMLGFKPVLIDELINKGYNPEWGARPLERIISETVEVYIAEKILEGSMKQGDRVLLGTEVF